MSLALLFHYLMLNMFRMLVHPSSGACDLFVELFHGLYCSGSMCVSVTVGFGWGGVVSLCRLKHCCGGVVYGCRLKPASVYHTTAAKQQADSSICSTNACCCIYSLELLMMDRKTVRNMSSVIPKIK